MGVRLIIVGLGLLIAFASPGVSAASLGDIVGDVAARHMTEKRIPGMSVAIVKNGRVVHSSAYGDASVELNIPATAQTVYPISSVSKIFAGLVALKLADEGRLDLDAPIADYLDNMPRDKLAVTTRHLLQHTHGLEDFYKSGEYEAETGRSFDTSTVDELMQWSLERPFRFTPGEGWAYSLAGYVMLARVLEHAGGEPYDKLVARYVFNPLGIEAYFGGSDTVITGRYPLLYKLVDDELAGHVADFQPIVWAAGGANVSVKELSKLFIALSDDDYLDDDAKQELWRSVELPDGRPSHYALGWFSYTSSQDRWVVGHEGGGASWVIYYPDLDIAVIALSNMSGARADSLPFEIARQAFDAGLL